MLDISRHLSGTSTQRDIYNALVKSVITVGASRCTLYVCDELDNNNTPTYAQIVFVSDTNAPISQDHYPHFPLA